MSTTNGICAMALITMPTLYGVGRCSLIGEPPDALDQTSGPERFLEQHGSHAGVQSLASLGVEIERGDQQEGDRWCYITYRVNPA